MLKIGSLRKVVQNCIVLFHFVKGNRSKHIFAVLFKITETKQACLKSCYSKDLRILYDPVPQMKNTRNYVI